MSTDSTRIHCTGCDYIYSEHYEPIVLICRMESGTVRYYRTHAWCYNCDTITDAEKLPEIDEVRREYENWCGDQKVSWLKKLLRRHDQNYQEKLKILQNRIAWLEARTAPPHCLDCGSTNLTTLNFKNNSDHTAIAEGFKHSCGGALVHDYNDKTGIRYSLPTTKIWVDVQGNKLDEAGKRLEDVR